MNDYAIQTLNIKLWEWQATRDKLDRQIIETGPEEFICNNYNTCTQRIEELTKAIDSLTTQPPQ